MAFKVSPYMGFSGRAADALAYYQGVFGGRLDITHYRDMPMEDMPGNPDWVMHGQLELDNGVTLMAADGPQTRESGNVEICLYGDDATELERCFEALSDGGRVELPFEPAPWGSYFGQVTDQFGISWMLEGGSTGEQPAQ
ncbi:VOC family protein [Microbacterium sp. Marseille-Q6965]|uniref:VOC family protein n=1 Tax=Microbacterium sp. Marseille-Q6965 TaxID=2965072 RepID=UPI0021B7D1E7|nr:VOC family protein [Microbacterium sp. Marseille-Q6965]